MFVHGCHVLYRGPLFTEGSQEREKKPQDVKQKNKKQGKSKAREDAEEKKAKKSKKGVMRFLHKGRYKATNLLDDLQYEGDELKRRKARRHSKRRSEDEQEEDDDTDDDTGRAGRDVARLKQRVSSESRLQDGRGRLPPSRSRTMSSIPSETGSARGNIRARHQSAPARIICEYCERGEKRRTWDFERDSSLKKNAPLSNLFDELTQEKELISTLLTRYDYLISSVSDSGDLLIQLFTPQLKEDPTHLTQQDEEPEKPENGKGKPPSHSPFCSPA